MRGASCWTTRFCSTAPPACILRPAGAQLRLCVSELRAVSAHDAAGEPGVRRRAASRAWNGIAASTKCSTVFASAEVAGRRPHEVSGGQKQRCSIARALIGAPKLLLLDEPAHGLDAPLRAELYDVLRQVRADFKTPFLLVTHDLDECFELAEEMLIMREGRIVQSRHAAQSSGSARQSGGGASAGPLQSAGREIRSLDPGRNKSRVLMGEVRTGRPVFSRPLQRRSRDRLRRPEQLNASRAERPSRPQPNPRGT